MIDPVAFLTAAAGALIGVSGAYVALRRDSREARGLALTDAKETIDLLREQTTVLRDQATSRDDQWRHVQEGWQEREARLEKRVTDIERDYRRLVLTVTTMGLCANAATCPNYNAGDRRRALPLVPEEPEQDEDARG